MTYDYDGLQKALAAYHDKIKRLEDENKRLNEQNRQLGSELYDMTLQRDGARAETAYMKSCLDMSHRQLAEARRWARSLFQFSSNLIRHKAQGLVERYRDERDAARKQHKRAEAYLRVTLDMGNRVLRERDEARAWARKYYVWCRRHNHLT